MTTHLLNTYAPAPEVFVGGDGAELRTQDGRVYLDFLAGIAVSALGHNHPRLVRALARQAELLCHTSLAGVTHENAALLAEEMVAVAPAGLSRVFFSDDGSTAVEAAIKMAAQLWRNADRPEKSRFVALDGAFHGETVGAASLGGIEVFRRPFAGVLFECLRAPFPGGDDAYGEVFRALERLLRERGHEIAAVVLEPLVQGASGMRIYPESYLAAARRACTESDVLLIVDEVFTGYGRTGAMWACDLAGVAPDLLCTAKGFTAGVLPMAATLATERLYDGFRGPGRALMHGHTFCGHPLGAAVAREVLAIYRDDRVLDGVAPRAARIAAAMARIATLPGVQRVRSLGMVGAADLGDGGYHGAAGPRFYDAARRRGLYLRPLGDTVYVCPPLTIPLAELDLLLDGLHDAIVEATA